MFNNIIYFIIVLLIFSINYPDKVPKDSLPFSLGMLCLTWVIFAAYCRFEFQVIQRRFHNQIIGNGTLSAQYQQIIARLSILSIFLFALAVYLLNLKYWIQKIPATDHFSVLQGIIGLLFFFIYLFTIWYFSYPVYLIIFGQKITRWSFIRSNLRLNLPILFPWLLMSLVVDIITLIPWVGTDRLLSGVGGNILFFSGFIILLMIFMPAIIQYWWGCKPLETSEKAKELRSFLRDKGFGYRHLLRWPIFEGRMMTAGIMGVVARYRYILITDSLMEILTTEELKAVLAHEMGHARYRHLPFYVLFLVGFMVISFGLQDLLPYVFSLHPFLMKLMSNNDSQSINLFYLTLSIPMLIILVIYFRYIMGFFMRNFERQADLYSAKVIGTPLPTISSLEKIAYFSGKIMDAPSWHHFSIRQRIEYLKRTLEDPGLVSRHNRWVAAFFLVYLVCVVSMGYALNFSPVKQHIIYSIAGKVLAERLLEEPNNISLNQSFAMLCHEMGEYEKAIKAYERIITLDSNHTVSLNNLAWILVTVPDESLRDTDRALVLAKRAVALEKSEVFLDTLAEAYYKNGFVNEAVETIKEAISLAKENRKYYEKQLEKFLSEKN